MVAELLSKYDTSVIECCTRHRIVNNEAAIQWEGYYYIVPSQYMYETCAVRIGEDEITIYSPDCKQIAKHPLAEKGRKNRYIGRKDKTQKYVFTAGEVALRLEAFGPVMQEYIQAVKKIKSGSYRHHLRHILSLKANYRSEDIIAAVKRALKFRVFEAKAIDNFLKMNAEKKSEITFPPKYTSNEQE